MLSAKEIRERQTEALGHELAEKQKHLFDLRTQAVTEKLEDPSQLRKTRKEIARIKTILRERHVEAGKNGNGKAAEKQEQEGSAAQKTTKKKTTTAKLKKKPAATRKSPRKSPRKSTAKAKKA